MAATKVHTSFCWTLTIEVLRNTGLDMHANCEVAGDMEASP